MMDIPLWTLRPPACPELQGAQASETGTDAHSRVSACSRTRRQPPATPRSTDIATHVCWSRTPAATQFEIKWYPDTLKIFNN